MIHVLGRMEQDSASPHHKGHAGKTSNLMGKALVRPHLNLKIFWQLVAAGGTRVTFFCFCLLLMDVLTACLFTKCVCAWYPWKPEEGIESPGTGITDDYELLCGC